MAGDRKGHANTSLHSRGFKAMLSDWQLQVLVFGTFWEKNHFSSTFNLPRAEFTYMEADQEG